MNNPFISYTEDKVPYLTDICSINKLQISTIPFDVEDDILGLKANEIFSTKVIAKKIRENAYKLGIDADMYSNSQLVKKLEEVLDCDNQQARDEAERLYKLFGYRLGIILLTLKQGLSKNRQTRPGWSDDHWRFWNELDRVILVGGLTNGKSGEKLKEYAQEVFAIANEEPYNILLFSNASHYGTLGCATQIMDKSKSAVVFDFGQTNIKRCIVDFEGDNIVADEFLESIPSIYMEWTDISDEDRIKLAHKLHERILSVIVDTYTYAKERGNVGDEIIMSIASYVVDGVLHNKRGGYAKLAALAPNYGQFLESELRKKLGENITIKLIHDGSAIAMYFKEYKDSVCISLGTAFGVGFPD